MDVVFCKDCKFRWTSDCWCYYLDSYYVEDEGYEYTDTWLLENENDYCSRGERQ